MGALKSRRGRQKHQWEGDSGRGRQRKDEAEGKMREIQSLRKTWQVTAAIKEEGRGSLAKQRMWPLEEHPQPTASGKWGPQSYNFKELNFANNLKVIGSRFFPRRYSREEQSPDVTLTGPHATLSRRSIKLAFWLMEAWDNQFVLF